MIVMDIDRRRAQKALVMRNLRARERAQRLAEGWIPYERWRKKEARCPNCTMILDSELHQKFPCGRDWNWFDDHDNVGMWA